MAFDQLFPQTQPQNQAQPAPEGAGTPAGLPGGAPGQGKGTPPSAIAMIEQFVKYAKSQNMQPDEIVELIMSAITSAGYQAPPEEKVRQLVNQFYAESPGGTETAPAEGVPPEGGLPQEQLPIA